MGNVATTVDAIKAAKAAGAPALNALAAAQQDLADAQNALDLAIAANAAQAAIIAAYEAADTATDTLLISTAAFDTATSTLVASLAAGNPAVDAADLTALSDAVTAVNTLLANAQAVVAALLSAPGVAQADIDDAQAYVTAIQAVIPLFAQINLGDGSVSVIDTAFAAAIEGLGNSLPTSATDLDAQIDASLAAAIALDAGIATATQAVADATAAVAAAAPAAEAAQIAIDTAGGALRTMLEGFGIPLEESPTGDILKATLFIGNVAPDEGLSAPFNGWMTLFGQFFDHGLDLVAKGGWGSVYVPLQPDDPQYVEGSNTNFMVLTRSTVTETAGADGILLDDPTTIGVDESADNTFEPVNLTTPFVDQNQTYTSTPSAQVFHREYEMRFDATLGYEVPKATGRLLNGADGGLATWADVKAQALNLLGIELDDFDIHRIPEVVVDAYGNFIPGPNGFPQLMTAGGPVAVVLNPDGTIATPIDASTALATGHAFLDDIAHNANPGEFDANPDPLITTLVRETADADTTVSTAADRQPAGTYDNELLDAHFITGDGRGNENIGLTAVHHVFHAEHNRQIDLIKGTLLSDAQTLLANGATDAQAVEFLNNWLAAPITALDLQVITSVDELVWNGERLFQAAKFPTEMQYQHLVFEEFARKVQPAVNIFNDYDATLNPAILAEFAHTVYRFGHSMLTESVDRLDANFTPIGSGGVAAADAEQIGLIEAFLNPIEFSASGATADEAAGNIIRGMTRQHGNEIDEFVTEALRNNLVGLPLDLATLNLARGRETGVPTLNEARAEFFAGSGDAQVKPYASWFEFAQNLKNPASVINFIAAYGTHQTILDAVTLDQKRDAATALVLGGAGAPADRLQFLNHTGAYATDTNIGGLNDVDFWIGGLAEKKLLFGGFLGSTFNFVFETQLEALQNGDRFYYLSRLANLNLTAQLENNKFSEMIHRNTTATHLPGDAFALPNFFLEADISKQYNPSVMPGADGILGDDPTTVGIDESLDDLPANADPVGAMTGLDPFLGGIQPAVIRTDANNDGIAERLEYTGAEHVVLGGTEGADYLIGGAGDDTLWGDGGDDRLEGGDGNDLHFGGAGNDIITDVFGIDEIRSNEGDDVVSVGRGIKLIITDTGRDWVWGGVDDDEVLAGQDDDFVNGGQGVDFIIGGEGNDWLESGTENGLMLGDNGDLVQGLPIKRSVDSKIVGHDVLLATGGNADFDAETGDDIMVGGLGTDRFFGQFGFDWATYKDDPFGLEADMNLRLFAPPALPGSPAAILDRYAQTESLSGSHHADILRGDDLADLGAGAVDGLSHVLLDTNVALINGFEDLLGAIDEAGEVRFSTGNILLGGDGSDLIEGRGGSDIIDGDRWLNVRIERISTGETHDTMAGFQERVLAGEIPVADLRIVREILSADGATDVDTAQFSGVLAEYSIEGFDGVTANDANGDGFISVSHDLGGVGLGADGVDLLKNIERLRFADQTIDIVDLTGINSRAVGQPTIAEGVSPTTIIDGTFNVGEVLTASIAGVTDADNVTAGNPTGAVTGTVVFNWQVELVPGTGVFTNITRVVADELVPVTGPSITLTDAEGGLNLRVIASFKDAQGVIETVVSDASPIGGGAGGGPLGAPVVPVGGVVLGLNLGGAVVDGVVLPDPTFGILEDEPLPFVITAADLIASADGLSGITDPNGDLLTISNVALRLIAGDPVPGTFDVTLDANNNFVEGLFTPAANFNGGVTLTFDVSDGINVVPAEGLLEVLPVNDAPAAPTPFVVATVAADAAPRTVTFTDAQLFGDLPTDANGRALDIDGDRVAILAGSVALAAGQQGTLVDNLDGTYTYTAPAGFFGNVTIEYTIDDGTGLADALTPTTTSLAVGRTFNGAGATADNISGTAARDILNGNGGADTLNGLAGDDTLTGGAGVDTLNGGDGNDTLNGGAAGDFVNGGLGNDTIILAATQGRDIVDGGLGGTDTLVINGTAGAEVYRVFARASAELAGLTGLAAGTDIVITRNTNGVAGAVTNANIITELNEIEEIVINTAGGVDTVLGIGDFNPTNLAFNTIRVRSDNSDGTLDTIDDSMLTSEHNMLLDNGAGPLPPAGGNVGASSPANGGNFAAGTPAGLDGKAAPGSVPSGAAALGQEQAGSARSSSGNSSGDDDNCRSGGAVRDYLYGSSDDDTFFVDHARDRIIEKSGGGDDWVNSKVDFSLSENVEHLRLVGSANLEGVGNSANNNIIGNAGHNILDGGFGDDVLTGGAGRDTFVYGEGYGADTITDFQIGKDLVELLQGLDPVQGVDSRIGLVFDFGDGNVLTLLGVHDTSLNPFA
ncbi:MAG: peroxidase family protein [Hyphomicrobium sp.]|nr:peroxidase family protein [Hyphomicrobium sp.]